MASQTTTLRVRVNQIDYTIQPSGPLDNTTLPRAPVIRIYGESSIGRKACVHIHQVYPYFFVEYAGKMAPTDGVFQLFPNSMATNLGYASESPYS